MSPLDNVLGTVVLTMLVRLYDLSNSNYKFEHTQTINSQNCLSRYFFRNTKKYIFPFVLNSRSLAVELVKYSTKKIAVPHFFVANQAKLYIY